MTTSRDIAISGMGLCSPLGRGVSAFWEALCAGTCGIRPLTRIDAERYPFRQAGEIVEIPTAHSDDPPAHGSGYRFLRVAVAEALDQAGLIDAGTAEPADAVGLVLATNFGDNRLTEAWIDATRRGVPIPPRAASDTGFQSVADAIAAQFRLRGPRTVLSLSCASGAAAIAVGADWIRAGHAARVLVGGFDAISDFWWSGLSALRAMTTDMLRPFDRQRSGTIFGEGAAVLLLERADLTRRRGGTVLARLAGSGLSNNAFHLAAPDKEAAGLGRAMARALADAGLQPGDIDHVNCHGTGTRYNDVTETQAIKNLLGARAREIPLTANKSMTSHTMGAAGAMEAVASVMTLRTGMVPPTINLREQDPECDLNVTPHTAARHDVETVLSNSAGIGGCNAALVFARASA